MLHRLFPLPDWPFSSRLVSLGAGFVNHSFRIHVLGMMVVNPELNSDRAIYSTHGGLGPSGSNQSNRGRNVKFVQSLNDNFKLKYLKYRTLSWRFLLCSRTRRKVWAPGSFKKMFPGEQEVRLDVHAGLDQPEARLSSQKSLILRMISCRIFTFHYKLESITCCCNFILLFLLFSESLKLIFCLLIIPIEERPRGI